MRHKFLLWIKYAASLVGSQFIYGLLRIKCGYQGIEVIAATALLMFAVLFTYLETIKPTSRDKPLNLYCAVLFILGMLISYHCDISGYRFSLFLHK